MTNIEMLAELKDLTEQIQKFPPIIKRDLDEGTETCHYAMVKGECKAYNLFRSNDVCVDRWTATKDTLFPWHAHKEQEWVIVVKGSIKIEYTDPSHPVQIAKEGGCVYNHPNVEHNGVFTEDSEFITIMVPPSPDYPGAE